MTQQEDIGTFRDVFSYLLRLWGSLIILVFFPMEVLYRLDGLNAHLPPSGVIMNISVMVVFISVVLVAMVLFASGAVIAGNLITRGRITQIFFFVNNVFALAYVLDVIALNTYRFVQSFWQFEPLGLRTELLISFILISSIIAIVFRKKLNKEIKELSKLFKLASAIVLLSMVVIGFRAVQLHSFGEHDNEGSALTYPSTPTNIILVTFDALAAENMSLYGYFRETTPQMDMFAEESYIFNNMYAGYNSTAPSVISLLTGKYPTTHGAVTNWYFHIERGVRDENIAALMRTGGYQTAAVVSNYLAHPMHNMTYESFDYLRYPYVKLLWSEVFLSEIIMRLARIECFPGYIVDFVRRYQDLLIKLSPRHSAVNTQPLWPASLTFQEAIDYLESADSPFFLWVHVIPPHDPYLPSDKFKYAFLKEKVFDSYRDQLRIEHLQQYENEFQPTVDKLRSRYDEFLLDTDYEFGLFLEAVKRLGHYEDSIIIVSADHGESFEKGVLMHGGQYLYQPMIHIPLIIHMPGQEQGKRTSSNAETVDIAPTILELTGLEIPGWIEGESLVKAMQGDHVSDKPRFSMSLKKGRGGVFAWGTVAVIKDGYKYIYALEDGWGELYNLETDPGEMDDIVRAHVGKAAELKGLILEKLREAAGEAP
jgi:arylsulfatase A-like enzyme